MIQGIVTLVGFMGAGKSTVGAALAQRLEASFTDADAEVEDRAGASTAEIFDLYGEERFRQLERSVIADLIDGRRAVVALGGGALSEQPTRALLAERPGVTVVHLAVSFDEAIKRIALGSARPMLKLRDARTLYDERSKDYEEAAAMTVATDGRDVAEIVREIEARLALAEEGLGQGRPAGPAPVPKTRRIRVPVAGAGYEVIVGAGVMAKLGAELPAQGAEAAFVVTQPSLRRPAAGVTDAIAAGGLRVHVLEIPEGEAAKSPATAMSLWSELAGNSAHRKDLVIGVGGGVVTDVAGFVASTYNRGMTLVNVPTTLLGQVDAAIGGKNGVNLPAGKNLVGTFYQPALVLCDVNFLAELPDRELAGGMAEVAKYGFTCDPELLDLIRVRQRDIAARDDGILCELVARSAAIKGRIVAADERETGIREVLNYGHTFAHALERAAGYRHLGHGEAVAVGMMAAAHLADELGRIDGDAVRLHREVLQSAGLPVTAAPDVDDLYDAWLRDKKYEGGVRFVLLSAIGRPETGIEAPRASVEAAVKRLSA